MPVWRLSSLACISDRLSTYARAETGGGKLAFVCGMAPAAHNGNTAAKTITFLILQSFV